MDSILLPKAKSARNLRHRGNRYIFLLLIIPLIEPLLFKEPPFIAIDNIYSVARIIVLFFLIYRSTIMRVALDSYIASLIVLIFVYASHSIAYNPMGLLSLFGPTCSIISAALLFANYKESLVGCLEVIRLYFSALFSLNLISVLICLAASDTLSGLQVFDASISDDAYLLGMDNRLIFYTIPAVACALILNDMKGVAFDGFLCFFLLQGVFILAITKAAGGLIGIVLVCLLLPCARLIKGRAINVRSLIGAAICAHCIVLGLCISENYEGLITFTSNYLGKDATVFSRIDLWNLAIKYLENNNWIGVGYQNVDAMKEILIRNGHPHNLSLTLLLRGGFLAAGSFLCVLVIATNGIYSKRTNAISKALAALVFVCLILDIADSYDDANFYLFLAMIYYSVPRIQAESPWSYSSIENRAVAAQAIQCYQNRDTSWPFRMATHKR